MDRRAIAAVVLMMVIAIVPSFLLKKPRPPAPPPARASAADTSRHATPDTARAAPPPVAAPVAAPAPAAAEPAADSVVVQAPLYTYVVSTRGGRLTRAALKRYRMMAPGTSGPVELLRPESDLLGLTLVNGRDTIPLDQWVFTPSTHSLTVSSPASLTLAAARNGIAVELTYTFDASYHVAVQGRVTGLGPDGGLLFVGLGDGLRNTETDSVQNGREYAVVVNDRDAHRTSFGSLDPGEIKVLSGPYSWAAIKSKYFVTGLFAPDTGDGIGRIAGVVAQVPANQPKHPAVVRTRASLAVPASGAVAYALYAGPMEHNLLTAQGHGFDDVNPVGWPGFRTMIRFFAVPTRWLLVQMHDQLGIAYGLGLVIFGLLIRVLLWPLNQKGMRASIRMQAIQPHLKAAQDKHKNDPQKLQQEMFRLYKEHGVNPASGCWPMLIPWPVLFALFFVFQNAIELRGQPFLWLPDLAQPDPIYIIPILLGLSMFALSWIGQRGIEQTSQTRMMLYTMPAVMTLIFWRLASGLNLYYLVSNLASLPQQWLLSKERGKAASRKAPATK